MENKSSRVIFFDEQGEPAPMEFEGASARFFNVVRDCFCDPENKDLKAIAFNASFVSDGGQELFRGGMSGDGEALVRLIANLVVGYAVNVSGQPMGVSVADINGYALKLVHGIEREAAKSKGGIILPKGV